MPPDLLIACAAIAAGGLLKGATGAGAPLVGVPILAMLYDVPLAVAVFVLPNLVTNARQLWQYRADLLPGAFTWRYAMGGAAGAVAGSFLLATAPGEALLLTLAAAVWLYIGFRLARPGWRLSYAAAHPWALAAGGAAGVLQGASGVSAPISVGFLNAMRLPRPVFVATISAFFGAMSLAQVPAMVGLGLLTWERALYSLAALVPLLIFIEIGGVLGRRFSAAVFDRIVLGLLALLALRLIWLALT